jgi:hypothetical protein
MSDAVISDEIMAAMRAEAISSGGGSFIRLDAKGEFVTGVVARLQTDEAPFGTVEELILTNVRTHDGPRNPDDEVSFRLSRSVLRSEFGTDADDGGAKPGMIIFCEAQGEAMSKAGKPYFRYSCMKKSPEAAAEAAKAAPPKATMEDAKAALAETFGATPDTGDTDIPF